jgi:hypothetical protein
VPAGPQLPLRTDIPFSCGRPGTEASSLRAAQLRGANQDIMVGKLLVAHARWCGGLTAWKEGLVYALPAGCLGAE